MFTPMMLIAILAACLTVSATPTRRQATPCTFVMNAVGEPNGTVREDHIGENRIGGTYARGVYYFNGDTLFDTLNHNCIVSSTTQQFQCTPGVGTSVKFTVTDLGNLAHDGVENWLACPANDGSYLIYSNAKTDSTGCETVTLRTGGYNCTALGRPSSTTAASSSPTSTQTPNPACPTDISSGNFQYPHLIVPTSPEAPDHAFGNSYSALISPNYSTLFNFDVPPSYSSLTCALVFLFPYGTDLDPAAGAFYFSGIEQEKLMNGGLNYALLSGTANNGTTYASTPAVKTDYGKTQIIPGNKYTIATFPCPAGETVTYSVSSVNGVEFDYFQNSAPSAIGLYIVPCSA